MSGIEVRPLVHTEFAAWEALVADSPAGSPYASPTYLDVLCAAAGGRSHVLGVWKGQELVGGLPLYERDGGAGLRFVTPRLLLYYLGPVLRDTPTKYPSQRTSRHVEVLGALADALAGSYDRVQLKCHHTVTDVRPFLTRGWSAWPSYSYVVTISDLDAAWSRVEQNLRRLVERCTRQGMAFAEEDDVNAIYALHHAALARKDAAAYLPEEPFRRYVTRLRELGLCRLYSARLADGRLAAAQVVLTGTHPVTHTVMAAADPAHLASGVNAFLRWRSFEALHALGYQGNDLTDAALNPVTHFKAQLGGDLVTCLVLDAPRSLRWRLIEGARSRWQRGRGALGRLVRGGGS